MRLRRFLSILSITIAFAACAKAPPETTHAPTGMAQSQNLPPPEMGGIDLESLIIQSGDLPDEITPTEYFDDVPSTLYSVPSADQHYSRGLEWTDQAGGGEAGFVVALVYAAPQEVNTAWSIITEDLFSFETVAYLGERAAGDFENLVFTRCQTLVFIHIEGVYLEEDIIPFGRRIDRRLSQTSCMY